MLFLGLAFKGTFVQNLTKNLKSIFSIFLQFIFSLVKKLTREKRESYFFFKVNHMVM